jgi:RHS repeat-associated protein
VQKEYIWLGDTPLAVFDGPNLFYVHPDHLDRPVMTTNSAAQTIAWAAKYDPFGNPVTVTVSPVNNQRLPGQWFQIEDGLAYNWHRTYDATLGRYSQADPLGFVDGPSLQSYAKQSPLMKVDADGRTVIGPMSKPPKPPNPNGPKQCTDDCGEEWAMCRILCKTAQFDSDMPNIWGGSLQKCLMGCVSMRCGGNPI